MARRGHCLAALLPLVAACAEPPPPNQPAAVVEAVIPAAPSSTAAVVAASAVPTPSVAPSESGPCQEFTAKESRLLDLAEKSGRPDLVEQAAQIRQRGVGHCIKSD